MDISSRSSSHGREKRVVSFFIWDPELEHKIDREVKMIDGISKLLNVATTSEQKIECHKALILSQQRMLSYMGEIQRKQKNLLKKDVLSLEPTKATIALSDIRFPLIWNKIKGKSEQKKFAVFCLARVGCEIIDTQLKLVDKSSSEVLFTDKLVFDNVPHDFQLHLEIYALNPSLALSSSIKEFANRYSYFSTHGSPPLSRKRPPESSNTNNSKTSDQPQSKFLLMGRTIFTKDSADRAAQARIIVLERSEENPLMLLPIANSFIARFLVQPLCYTRLASFVGIVEFNDVKYSCTISAGFFNGEEWIVDDYTNQHRFSIPITSDTVILCQQERFSFSIFNRGFDQHEFFVQDSLTLNSWIKALQQHVIDIGAWQSTFEHLRSIGRYSHQPLTSTPTSTINSKYLNKKSILRNKAQSLDNLHQIDSMSSDIFLPNRVDEPTFISDTTAGGQSFDRDDNNNNNDDFDDDNVSVYRTRL